MRCITVSAKTTSRSSARLLVPQIVPKLANGLGVDLADARLRHAKDVADLGQRQPLEVVQGDDDLFALGKRVDGRRQHEACVLRRLNASAVPGRQGRRAGDT